MTTLFVQTTHTSSSSYNFTIGTRIQCTCNAKQTRMTSDYVRIKYASCEQFSSRIPTNVLNVLAKKNEMIASVCFMGSAEWVCR